MSTERDGVTAADLYLRLSDARNEEALDGREARLRARADELGWDVYRVIVENDLTPGNGNGGGLRPASAWKRRKITTPSGRVELRTIRPGFRAMLDDLDAGRANAILAEDLDRLLRQPRDGEDLIDAVEQAGATCMSLSGSLKLTEGGTNDERFMARMLANVASKASADTGRRVSAARDRLAGQSWQGGRRPYGYRPDPGSPKYHKTLSVVPAEAHVIKAAAKVILDDNGVSLKALARDLREDGISLGGGERIKTPTVTGTAWSAKTLREVLLKPAVAGRAVRNGKIVGPAPWPAILEQDEWERLRDLLRDPSRRTNTSRANEPRWLLSGFAACGVCGGRLRVAGGRNRAPAYVGAECCHVRRNAAAVDDYIATLVTDRLSEPDANGLLRPAPRPDIDARKLRAQLRKIAKRRADARRLWRQRTFTEAEMVEELRHADREQEQIGAQLAASDQADPLAEFRGRPAEHVWAELSIARRRAVTQKLIASVVINRAGRRGQGFDPQTLKVKWAPGV